MTYLFACIVELYRCNHLLKKIMWYYENRSVSRLKEELPIPIFKPIQNERSFKC